MKPLLLLINTFWAILVSTHSQAMWLAVPDAQLVKNSPLIVKATYAGSTNITVGNKQLYLGVLNIEKTYKGSIKDVVLINIPLKGNRAPRSDEINFNIGQKGLWLLQDSNQNGIYSVNNPQSFIDTQSLKSRLPNLLKLIQQQKN